MDKQTFIDSADSRETSREIMEAITKVARDLDHAEQIWEEGPTETELCHIVEIVTKNGMYDVTDFVWGAAGDEWATTQAR